MRKGLMSSVAALAASAGLAWGQAKSPTAAMVPVGGSLPSDPVAVGSEIMLTNGGPPTIVQPGIINGAIPAGTDPVGIPSGGGPIYPPPANFGPVDLTGQPPMPGPGYGMGGPGGPGGQPGQGSGLPSVYVNTEYLLYFMKAQPSNYPLVTTSAPISQGILGQPTTSNLLGGEDIGFGVLSGFRVTGGVWVDPASRVAIEASGFVLEKQSEVLDAISSVRGVPTIARPYVDSTTGQNVSLLAAYPEFAAGTVNIVADSQFWGTEGNILANLYRSKPNCPEGFTLNSLVGFRYLQLQEQMAIGSGSNLLAGNTAPFAGLFVSGPTVLGISDTFLTRNEFYGGQFGLQSEFRWGKMTLGVNSKVAIGNMHQRLDINGFTNLNTGSIGADGVAQFQSTSVLGGLFANAGNIGRYTHDEFSVIPEVNLNLGCQLTSWLNVSMGYNFLFIPDVIRPGDQISPVVDSSQVPTSFAYGQTGYRPVAQQMVETDFWVHGLNFAFTLRY